jgi:hypothetical protein
LGGDDGRDIFIYTLASLIFFFACISIHPIIRASMEKERWLSFLSGKISCQVAIERISKLQTWAFALLSLFCFSAGIDGINKDNSASYLYVSKLLFVSLWHVLVLFGLMLPAMLHRGEKTMAKLFGIRDFTSMITVQLLLAGLCGVLFMLSQQIVRELEELRVSGLFAFAAWTQWILAAGYLGGFLFYFTALFNFPSMLTKAIERSRKGFFALAAVHALVLITLLMSYSGFVPLGSATFFDQLRNVGLFWAGICGTLFFFGKFLQGSSIAALVSLEHDVAAGRLERNDDILSRFQEAFFLKRLYFWIQRTAHHISSQAHEIAQHLHETMRVVGETKPSEAQIAQMEDRYRKANGVYKKLDKAYQRYLLNISLFDLLEIEREKIQGLKDLFSKELRHAKLELAAVRKNIDEKLLSMKDGERKGLLEVEPVSVIIK